MADELMREQALVECILRYGGRCRQCADYFGICENGLPCDPSEARKAIEHVLTARAFYEANPQFVEQSANYLRTQSKGGE